MEIKKVIRSPKFVKQTKHLDEFLLEKLRKQIRKIVNEPAIGTLLRYGRGERALYVKPFRLVYSLRGDELFLPKFDHRKKIYK